VFRALIYYERERLCAGLFLTGFDNAKPGIRSVTEVDNCRHKADRDKTRSRSFNPQATARSSFLRGTSRAGVPYENPTPTFRNTSSALQGHRRPVPVVRLCTSGSSLADYLPYPTATCMGGGSIGPSHRLLRRSEDGDFQMPLPRGLVEPRVHTIRAVVARNWHRARTLAASAGADPCPRSRPSTGLLHVVPPGKISRTTVEEIALKIAQIPLTS